MCLIEREHKISIAILCHRSCAVILMSYMQAFYVRLCRLLYLYLYGCEHIALSRPIQRIILTLFFESRSTLSVWSCKANFHSTTMMSWHSNMTNAEKNGCFDCALASKRMRKMATWIPIFKMLGIGFMSGFIHEIMIYLENNDLFSE